MKLIVVIFCLPKYINMILDVILAMRACSAAVCGW